MAVIYSQDWYDALRGMIDGSPEFARVAPRRSLKLTLEVLGDGASPYVPPGDSRYYLLVLDQGKVAELRPLPARHDGAGLDFRFAAGAETWERIAAGLLDPITAGLRGAIQIRGDMRFLMQHAPAVKILVDLYAARGDTEWPAGRPPYAPPAPTS